MTVPAIEIRQLKKRYRRVEALAGLDVSVEQGSVCGFLGPNGAGKTTTMKILMGLIRSTSGWAAVLGEDVSDRGLVARTRIGYLPQDPVFPQHASVRNVVTSVARLYPGHRHGAALRSHVDELIDRVGMTDKARRKVHGLSGGERQRLGIAQALVGDPDLIILDEPSSGLDPVGRKDMMALIEEISAHATVFYSTHILDDVERISDTVVMISRGRAVAHGALEDILSVSDLDYAVHLRGDTSAVHARLSDEPWIDSVEVTV
ncbi:MAG: ATP-binding cassette domain-containing protein, partial [Proteobacteria bacterium]|nr:ATP-binding cassette domain-containing protein [Pseudomonadota bacterium]